MLAGTLVRDRALNPLANPSRLQRLWLCEAVRLREEQAGLLDDSAIVRQLRHEALDLPQRIEQRALRLAARDGQASALQHAVQGARLALLLLAVLAVAGGFSMALAALGDGLRPVNLLWALGSLLGLHLLSLLLWLLVTACLAQGPAPSGQLWLWLSARLARDAQAAQLAPSLLLLLQSQGLNRWLFAVLSHTLWLLLLLGALAGLLLLLASRHYGFVWESTLLDSSHFVRGIELLSRLPALLGFPAPPPALIQTSGGQALVDEASRQLWSLWLLGQLLTFGLLPRLALLLFSLARLASGLRRLQLDLQLPAYQLLAERLQPRHETLGVLDAAPPPPLLSSHYAAQVGQGRLLCAVELDPERPWPPAGLAADIPCSAVLDSREQRQQLLEQLAARPLSRLLIACDARRSPDRGSLALLRELASYATASCVWLLPGEDPQRLLDWQQALQAAGLPWQAQHELPRWLEHSDA